MYVTNAIFLAIAYIAGYQHVQTRRLNPLSTVQFWMIVFALAMMLVVTLESRRGPWYSVGFFLIAVASLWFIIRRHRYLPPRETNN